MRGVGLVAVAAAAALAAYAPVSARDLQGRRDAAPFQWRGTVLQGGAVEIKGVNGDVAAEPASGAEVEVAAVRTARRSNPEDVRIEVVQHADGVTICAVYPSRDQARPNECTPGAGGRMNVQDNDVNVKFTVRVPQGVRFVGHTVNGDVTAAFWLLIREADLTPAVFICPSASDDVDPLVEGGNPVAVTLRSNFSGQTNLSYGIQNPNTANFPTGVAAKWNNGIGPEVATAADRGPQNGGPSNLTTASTQALKRGGNSPNHNQDGQNILYGDSHVSFENTPFAGAQQTHIYLADSASGTPLAPAANRATTTGVLPQWDQDSVIMPYRP